MCNLTTKKRHTVANHCSCVAKNRVHHSRKVHSIKWFWNYIITSKFYFCQVNLILQYQNDGVYGEDVVE